MRQPLYRRTVEFEEVEWHRFARGLASGSHFTAQQAAAWAPQKSWSEVEERLTTLLRVGMLSLQQTQ